MDLPRHGYDRRCPGEAPGCADPPLPASPSCPGGFQLPSLPSGGFQLPSLPPSEAGVVARRGRTARGRRAPPPGLPPRAAAARPARKKFGQPACEGSTVAVAEGAAGRRREELARPPAGPALAYPFRRRPGWGPLIAPRPRCFRRFRRLAPQLGQAGPGAGRRCRAASRAARREPGFGCGRELIPLPARAAASPRDTNNQSLECPFNCLSDGASNVII